MNDNRFLNAAAIQKALDLLLAFADGTMEYKEFSARARRRSEGKDEDSDWEIPEGIDYKDYE